MEGNRIFFLSNIFNENCSIGITKKVHQQLDSLKRMGYSIYYTSYYDDFLAILDQNNNFIYKKKYKFNNRFIRKYLKNYELKLLAKSFLEQNQENYEFIYLRYMFFDKIFLSLLKICKEKSKKVIVEAHSYPIYNWRDILYYPIYIQDYLYTKKCAKYIDLVLGISEKKYIWNVKTVQIDNAIEVSEYKLSNRSYSYQDDINMIFVGFEYNVHGLDRIINSLKVYYKSGYQRNVNLLLVGKLSNKTLKLIKNSGIEDKIEYYGIKSGQELDDIFELADIGIGVLAPYRRKSSLGTGLKTKEYMARGLPIIYAGNSLSIDNECPFVYSVPNKNSIIDIKSIICFFDEIKKNPNIHQEIRKLVVQLTWEKEFKKMLDNL